MVESLCLTDTFLARRPVLKDPAYGKASYHGVSYNENRSSDHKHETRSANARMGNARHGHHLQGFGERLCRPRPVLHLDAGWHNKSQVGEGTN